MSDGRARPSPYAMERLRTTNINTYAMIKGAAEEMARIHEEYGDPGLEHTRYVLSLLKAEPALLLDSDIQPLTGVACAGALALIHAGVRTEVERAKMDAARGVFRNVGFGTPPQAIMRLL